MSNSTYKNILRILNAIVISTMAFLFLVSCDTFKSVANHSLILYNNEEKILATYPLETNDYFSIEFIHSVNKSPVVEYYKFDNDNNIYVYKTIYYNFGAGVPTELNENEVMSYGDDGSIIIDHIDKKIDNLTYYLSSIYDHILKINDGKEISLWEVCGKNMIISIKIT